MKDTCEWEYDEDYDDNVWNTECDNQHYFEEGGIKENSYKFCPYCGKKIEIKKGK